MFSSRKISSPLCSSEKNKSFFNLSPTNFFLICRLFVGWHYECDLFPLYFQPGLEIMVNWPPAIWIPENWPSAELQRIWIKPDVKTINSGIIVRWPYKLQMQDLNSCLCFSYYDNIKIILRFSGVKQSFITLMDQEFGQDTVSIASLCSLMSGARLEDGEVGYWNHRKGC